MRRYLIGIGIVIILSLFALLPLFKNGYFPMHDDTQVSRVIVMGKALREGQFPVRWVSDLGYGYGYPIFNFYGPLPYYFGGGLYALGMDALVATKTMFFVGAILAPICMFIAVISVLGFFPAVVAAIFYMYVPYHAVQIYVRGAVGEYWAYACIPLIFYGIWGLKNRINGKYILVGGLGIAGVITSHTIAGFILGIGLGLFMVGTIIVKILQKKALRSLWPLARLIALGLGLSAFFWLPALAEKQFTAVEGMLWDKTDYHDHFVCYSQLWNSLWGFGGSTIGCIDGLSFKLGKLHILGTVVGLLMWIVLRKKVNPHGFKEYSGIIMTGCIIVLVSVFMTLQISEPVWKTLPFSEYIQYPWRFLAFAGFGSSLLSGSLVFGKKKIVQLFISALLLVAVVGVNGKVFRDQYTYKTTSSFFENITDLRYRVSKISDEYLPPQIPRPTGENDIVRGTIVSGQDVSVISEFEKNTYNKYPVIALYNTDITIKKAYFPGFRYLVNGKTQKPIIKDGLPHLTVPEGNSVVEIFFDNTPIRTIANSISVCTLLILLFIYGKKTVC